MAKLGWICLALMAFLAIQASDSLLVEEVLVAENQDIIAEEISFNDDDGNGRHKSRGSHSRRSDSRERSKENIAPQLAAIFEYLYNDCKQRITASGLTLTRILGGYYYFYMGTSRLTWYDARNWCASRGMTLANLETAEENTAVTNRLNTLFGAETGNDAFVWIGGNNFGASTAFKWGTGALFGFTNWEANQPSNDANCVSILKRDGHTQWDDRGCDTLGRFVCEIQNPCSNILNMARKLKNSHKSASYHANIIHRRDISDSNRNSRSSHDRSSNDRSSSENNNPWTNAVDKFGTHMQDKVNVIGGTLSMLGSGIADKINMLKPQPPHIIITSNSDRSSRNSDRSSRNSNRSSRNSNRSSRNSNRSSRNSNRSNRNSNRSSSSDSLSIPFISAGSGFGSSSSSRS